MNFISKLFKRNNKAQEKSVEQKKGNAEFQSTNSTTATSEPVSNSDKLEEPQENEPITLKECFLAKYPSYSNILRMFEAANLCEATWENITKVRLQKFVDYMNERLSPNSVNQYATKLKAVFNLYSDEVLLPRGFAKVLTPKKCAVQNVYLTEQEIQRIVDYRPRNNRELYVRNLFILSCYIGCRHSDAAKLTASNIVGDTLQYVSIKTKIHSTVPLKPIVREYITTCPQIEIDDTTYNRIIRNICKKCGIMDKVKVFKAGEAKEGEKWEFISSHTSRRSFATNLYLRGVDLYTISRMIGHSSTRTTEGYICADIKTDSEELMSFFK